MQCPSCGNPHYYEGLEGPDCPDIDCSKAGQKKESLSLRQVGKQEERKEADQRKDQTVCLYCGCVPCADDCPAMDFDNHIFIYIDSGSSDINYNLDWDLLVDSHSDLAMFSDPKKKTASIDLKITRGSFDDFFVAVSGLRKREIK